MTWSHAQQYCRNELSTFSSNETVPNSTTHLVALENVREKTAMIRYMNGK